MLSSKFGLELRPLPELEASLGQLANNALLVARQTRETMRTTTITDDLLAKKNMLQWFHMGHRHGATKVLQMVGPHTNNDPNQGRFFTEQIRLSQLRTQLVPFFAWVELEYRNNPAEFDGRIVPTRFSAATSVWSKLVLVLGSFVKGNWYAHKIPPHTLNQIAWVLLLDRRRAFPVVVRTLQLFPLWAAQILFSTWSTTPLSASKFPWNRVWLPKRYDPFTHQESLWKFFLSTIVWRNPNRNSWVTADEWIDRWPAYPWEPKQHALVMFANDRWIAIVLQLIQEQASAVLTGERWGLPDLELVDRDDDWVAFRNIANIPHGFASKVFFPAIVRHEDEGKSPVPWKLIAQTIAVDAETRGYARLKWLFARVNAVTGEIPSKIPVVPDALFFGLAKAKVATEIADWAIANDQKGFEAAKLKLDSEWPGDTAYLVRRFLYVELAAQIKMFKRLMDSKTPADLEATEAKLEEEWEEITSSANVTEFVILGARGRHEALEVAKRVVASGGWIDRFNRMQSELQEMEHVHKKLETALMRAFDKNNTWRALMEKDGMRWVVGENRSLTIAERGVLVHAILNTKHPKFGDQGLRVPLEQYEGETVFSFVLRSMRAHALRASLSKAKRTKSPEWWEEAVTALEIIDVRMTEFFKS